MLAELAICVFSVVAVGNNPAPVEEAPKKDELQLIAIEQEIIDNTNRERQRYGLAPLTADAGLVRSARRHAAWMTNNRTLRHTSAPVAENIAMGQRDSYEAVRDWMSSPGHRANILNGRYRRMGAAAYRTPDGTIYWCQQFLY
jgi:uncharacterized protein YkwD